MRIAFNPSTVAALIAPPNNKDITFDLRGHNIFARGVKFCGTDTNTWRDIKINNVSIGSNILDLRNGSNTTLTNTNGVVTINSTWRPVVDNLTSDSTTSSLSAKQGKILKSLIDSKSNSGHTHDDRYVKKSGDTMSGALNFANGTWNLVGDDSYMGDCNISGHFGIKAANTTYPGIAFFNNASTFLGNLTAYSGNIKYGAYSLQFLDNGNTSVSASTWTNPFSGYNSNAVADGQAICVWGQSSNLSNLAADSGDMSLWLKRVNAKVATLNMVLDGEYYANGNQRLAHVSEIPNSLKNPHALTISLNGTSQGPYDGSAAKNINITPSSIGAATSGHNHDHLRGHRLGYRHLDAGPKSSWSDSRLYIGYNGFDDDDGVTNSIGFYRSTGTGTYTRTLWAEINSNGLWASNRFGVNGQNTGYNFYVNGTSLLNNTVRIQYNTPNLYIRNTVDTSCSIIRLGTNSNENASYIFQNGPSRTDDGGANTMTIRNNVGVLRLQNRVHIDSTGRIYPEGTSSRRTGMYGVYDSYKIGHIWSIGTAYMIPDNGANFGNLYGLAYKHTNNTAGGTMAGGHQAVWCDNGNPRSAIGYNGFWAAGGYYKNGSSDSYVLLGGGGHKTISSLSVNYANSAGSASNLTIHQYLSNTDTTWWPLIWGGSPHNNTSDSTGAVYKSYDKLSWQTSSQTLYATNIQTNNIKNLSVGGGIYWNPYVESASDGSDAASITVVKSGVAGGTTLVLSQMNDSNDTIQFKTNGSAKLYHNNNFILTSKDTKVTSGKGYINNTEITQVNNADKLDGWHKDNIQWTGYITSDTANLQSYWFKMYDVTITSAKANDVTITFLVSDGFSNNFSIFYLKVRQNGDNGSGTYNLSVTLKELVGNLKDKIVAYYNNKTGNIQLWGNAGSQWGVLNYTILKKTYRTAVDFITLGTLTAQKFTSVQTQPTTDYTKVTMSRAGSVSYSDSTGSVHWNNVTNKPSTFAPAAHTHTVFNNNLMIKGTNGISDSASIHLGIGDSDTGFKWISDGVCQIYANNVAVGEWTSGGMNWFKNPTVNGNKVWNAGNDGPGSGLDADTLDGYHATDGRTFNGNIHWSNNWNDTWSDGDNKHPWYGFDHRYPNTGAYSTTISDYFGMTIKTANTLRLDCRDLLINGTNISNLNVASASKLQTARSIWGQSFNGTADVNGTIYINNSDSSNGAIRLNNNVNSNARISAISDQVIFNTSSAIRFGETDWDWNQWAGLKYTHSNKTIYLGIADGSVFNSNSTQSGGTLNLRAGISNIDLNSGTAIRGLPTNGSPYSSRVTLNDTSISLSAYGDISMSTGPGAIELTSGYSGVKLSCSGNNASINPEGFKVEASQGVYLNSGNSGDVNLCVGGGKVGIGYSSPSYKLDVNGQMRADGFHHSSVNSDNYMLLAGGGYKSFGGDSSHPIFLGYLNLDHGNDGTVSSSFYCLGYSVSFTYTRGGNYCKISIPDTSYQTFYIRAAIASVNYSGGGMDTWAGYHRGSGAWWLHCYASGMNEVRVKGFRQSNDNNDSWWGGNPLWSGNDGANRITVCIFGYVTFK